MIILLVLCMGGFAHAAVGLSIDGTNWTISDGTEDIQNGVATTVYVVSTVDGTGYKYDVKVDKSDATLSYPSINTTSGDSDGYAGNLAYITDYSDSVVWDYELSQKDSGGNAESGWHFSMSLTDAKNVGETFVLTLYEYGISTIDTITFTVVPEPMTILLLGFGGLFLRRSVAEKSRRGV